MHSCTRIPSFFSLFFFSFSFVFFSFLLSLFSNFHDSASFRCRSEGQRNRSGNKNIIAAAVVRYSEQFSRIEGYQRLRGSSRDQPRSQRRTKPKLFVVRLKSCCIYRRKYCAFNYRLIFPGWWEVNRISGVFSVVASARAIFLWATQGTRGCDREKYKLSSLIRRLMLQYCFNMIWYSLFIDCPISLRNASS